MKKMTGIPCIIVAVFIIAIFLTAGCDEQQQAANPKKDRLIGSENIELKKQLEKKDAQIAGLKKALDTCEFEKVKIQKDSEKQINSVGTDTLDMFEKTIKLQEENENLKKQVEELKKTGQK
jgi:regulatory protein YycI of two-component signal transduction system YycFG